MAQKTILRSIGKQDAAFTARYPLAPPDVLGWQIIERLGEGASDMDRIEVAGYGTVARFDRRTHPDWLAEVEHIQQALRQMLRLCSLVSLTTYHRGYKRTFTPDYTLEAAAHQFYHPPAADS